MNKNMQPFNIHNYSNVWYIAWGIACLILLLSTVVLIISTFQSLDSDMINFWKFTFSSSFTVVITIPLAKFYPR